MAVQEVKSNMWNTSSSMDFDSVEFTETFMHSKYEVNTLFKASLFTDKCFSKTISCMSSSTFIVLTLEAKLSVFKVETQELFWELEFDSRCGSISLLNDYGLLLVVEQPGTIHLLHLESSSKIWSSDFEHDDSLCTVQNALICSHSSDSFAIYVYTKEGILFEISKVETSTLFKALEEKKLSEFFKDIHVEKIDLSSVFPDCSVTRIFKTYSQVKLGLEIENSLSDESVSDYFTIEDVVDGDFTSCNFMSDWDLKDEERKFKFYNFSGYGEIKKALCSRDNRYIICLNEKNELLVFSSFTLLNLAVWGDGDIQDFVLYETLDPVNLSISDCKVGILRKYRSSHIFEIRKFPSFEFVHKIQLSEFAMLVESKPNQDAWYVLEGNQPSNAEIKALLKIVSVSETRPEIRLLTLLNRRKFKEAEKYAKMCNLNDEVIFKTKINCMLKDYSMNPNVSCTKQEQESLWKEVEESLNKIKDVEFVKSCISLLVPEMEVMKKYLSIIHNWLVSNNIECAENLISEINKNENMLITYNILPDSIRSNLSMKDFLQKDLLQYMISELISGGLTTALIIWQRHKNELLSSLTSEQIREILNAIPGDIPSHHLMPFLREEFLPPVLLKFPDAVDLVVDWIIPRIHYLELTEKESWPENGEKLACMLLELIDSLWEKSEKGGISYSTSISLSYIHKQLINTDFRVGCLYELSKNLKLLLNLKENFDCVVSLTTFQDSKMDVLFAVLDRIKLKFICKVVTEFIRPFAFENDLDLDLSLELYIKHTISTSYFTWWSWDESPWEERLTLVLECIKNLDNFLNAALFLVSHATVPWSDKIKSIVEQGLNSDHPRHKEFQQQSKQVILKEILVKYEIRNFPMNNNFHLICTLVNFVLKQNKASALEDAKMVILSCNESLSSEHYLQFLQFYLDQNKLDELVSLHSSLPSNIAIKCSNRLLRLIIFGLEDSFVIENGEEQTDTYLRAGIHFIEFLKSKKEPVDLDLLNAFRSMKKLKKEFGISVVLNEVIEKRNATKIVEQFINSIFDAAEVAEQKSQLLGKNMTVAKGIFKIKRLGCILDVKEEYTTALLITNCLKRKKYDLVIKLCGELVSSHQSSKNAKTLLEVVNHFLENIQDIKNLSFETILATVCHLSNLAVTFCDNGMIKECMYAVQLSTYLAVLNKITGQQLRLARVNADSYHKWKFHPLYEDKGFQLDISQVVDFVQKIIPLFLRNHKNLEKAVDLPVQEMFTYLFKPLITQMKEKGQAIAAVRTMYLFYHSQMEFYRNEVSTQEAFMLIAGDLKSVAYNIIQNIIDKRKLDLDLSFGLLTLYPNEPIQVLEKLQKWSTKDLRCILSLGEIGSECCRVLEKPQESCNYDQIYQRASLMLRHNIKSAGTDIILRSSDSNYHWEVVKELILSPKITLSTIFECCSAFDLVTDHVMIAYLNNLLIEAEKICLTNVEIPEEKLQSMLNRTKCVIEAITSDELIVKNLENLLKKISSYSYEVLLFILEQLLCASASILTIRSGQFEKNIALLNFLRVYQRVSPPGEIEIENWISQHSTVVKFPVIANKRLPFWTILEDDRYRFKMINPELTPSTLRVWLQIAPLLNISKDDLVMIAVKNSVMAYLKKFPSKSLIVMPDKILLRSIQEMLENISDSQAYVTCALWVATRMPPGGNKVYASLVAKKYAENWQLKCPNDRNPADILKKSTALYHRSAVESILYHNNLAHDIPLSYADSPVKLAEYFTEEFFMSAESGVKVCRTLSQIAQIVDIKLGEIFCKFFYKWLNFTQTRSFDESFALNNSSDDAELEDTNEKNILRSINLILGASTIGINICEIMKKDYGKMTITQRSRFIFCTVAAHGMAYVSESLNIPPNVLEESLPTILYASELECLHLLYSKEMIHGGDILELIHSILCDQSNNSKAILCCVRICLEHKIWKAEIWDIILQQLIALSLTESLHDILRNAQGQLIHIWHYKSFICAWNSIISNSFKTESSNLSGVVERVYSTILGCPCASALDIESLWNDLKYAVHSLNGKDLKDREPVSDACTFIQILKSLKEDCE